MSAKKQPTSSKLALGVRRGVFLRIPVELHQKLCRMAAQQSLSGERATIQGTVIALIEQAREKREE
jgi:hypothetical protein